MLELVSQTLNSYSSPNFGMNSMKKKFEVTINNGYCFRGNVKMSMSDKKLNSLSFLFDPLPPLS